MNNIKLLYHFYSSLFITFKLLQTNSYEMLKNMFPYKDQIYK